MNDQNDSQLLRAYVDDRSETAFAELVRRHVDFVYSAALRMVCDSHLAEDVTQGAFMALAKSAAQLLDRHTLSGWLHRATQNIAAQTVRTEVRRRVREQEAAAMTELPSTTPEAAWEEIAPHLDAALGELSEPDRDAVLLRYFERKSAREMAEILGVGEEAAQKRVNRAVERLREFFAKRGLTVGAGGLVAILSTNAVQAAPLGLALTVSGAGALAGTTVTAAATKAIAMTPIQKTLIATGVAVLAGFGIYEARQAAHLREQVQTLQPERASLVERLRRLEAERAEQEDQVATLREDNERLRRDTSRLPALRGEVGGLRSTLNSEEMQHAAFIVRRLNRLKQYFDETPRAKTPELQFLSNGEWVEAATHALIGVGGVNAEHAFRHAASGLRATADRIAADAFRNALERFKEIHGGRFPTELNELKPYFERSKHRSDSDVPITDLDAIFERWQIVPASQVKGMIAGGDAVITLKAPVDDVFDTCVVVGSKGVLSRSYAYLNTMDVLNPVYEAYAAAHQGRFSQEREDLETYVSTPEQKAALQRLMLGTRWSFSPAD